MTGGRRRAATTGGRFGGGGGRSERPDPTAAHRGSLRDLPGVIAIAATYVYFLLFAQYGLLALLAARLPGASREPVMAAMGACGLAASAGAAVALRRLDARALVGGAFLAATAAALAALAARDPSGFALAGAAVGASVGVLTVALSADLARWVAGARRGVAVGAGTGVAYLVANLPPLFAGSPERLAITGAVAGAVGLVAVALPGGAASADDQGRRDLVAAAEARGRGLVAILVAFVALVGLDSAAFAIVQESATLKASTWGAGTQSLRMGVLHLVGALAAGAVLDRRRLFALLMAVGTGFVAALALLERGGAIAIACSVVYALGIGAYSTALVLYPSSHRDRPDLVPRRFRAAAVYGVAGWLGSAAGVSVAERCDRIPPALIAVAALLLAIALLLRRRLPAALVESWALALGLAAVAVWTFGVVADAPAAAASAGAAGEAGPGVEARSSVAPAADAVARGRAVYVAEGCQHCHSQYVRPVERDRERWGPRRPGAGSGDPPLYGVRRQGPDLANVANRRSQEWQRLHLVDPRSVSPGSRMPTYDRLFAPGERRGDDLLAFLESLGASTRAQRFTEVQARAIALDPGASPRQGAALFALYCAGCHGPTGHGDGALARDFTVKDSLDLGRATLGLVSFGPGIGTWEQGLARVVRYGIPGTSMPGHEALDDAEVSALVAYLDTLAGHTAGGSGR